MHVNGSHCGDLVEKTAAALNDETVVLMLVAVQRDNVELSVKLAWKNIQRLVTFEVENVIRECLLAFPYIWLIKFSLSNFSEYGVQEELFRNIWYKVELLIKRNWKKS